MTQEAAVPWCPDEAGWGSVLRALERRLDRAQVPAASVLSCWTLLPLPVPLQSPYAFLRAADNESISDLPAPDARSPRPWSEDSQGAVRWGDPRPPRQRGCGRTVWQHLPPGTLDTACVSVTRLRPPDIAAAWHVPGRAIPVPNPRPASGPPQPLSPTLLSQGQKWSAPADGHRPGGVCALPALGGDREAPGAFPLTTAPPPLRVLRVSEEVTGPAEGQATEADQVPSQHLLGHLLHLTF
ncbi:uncharacterized protein LOC119250095 isoform X2 [Talpa occidentalis]|nr:uncharacterized protein LOC119250095 isoform X2 [Talpa occidentalis]